MSDYTVNIARSAQKQLDKAPRNMQGRLRSAIDALAREPRPPGCKKLVGRDAWRIREGDWRIIYQIRDRILEVEVIELGHRKDVYD